MARRKLSRQQLKRIKDSQQKRLDRSKEQISESDPSDSSLGPELTGLVTAHYGNTLDVRDPDGNLVRCHKRATLDAVVTGDKVVWCQGQDEMGVVVATQPRQSLLQRPDLRGNLRPVAANLDQVIIVLTSAPETPLNLVDRYLAAAHDAQLDAVLLLNKVDLLAPEHELFTRLDEYERLGFTTLTSSTKNQHGLDTLFAAMAGKSSVFVGQSGVGKSSLTTALLPDVDIATQTISESTGKGRHTTTRAQLYPLPEGGSLIDSPGIREFGLWHLSDEKLLAAYPELVELQGQCKFRNCRHLNEPGCAVLQAVETDQMLPRRYQSFIAIRDSLDEVDVRQE